jgi:sigma-E factor negative regulatory protein RseB
MGARRPGACARRSRWQSVSLILPGLLAAGGVCAETNADVMTWLMKIQHAAQSVNYTGLLVYQQGPQIQTSRITHAADAGGERERLEMLDGSPKEFIRNNDEVKCYNPETKTVIVEKRGAARTFPGLLTAQVGSLGQFYTMRLGLRDRVAGFACQMILLEPKDDLRFGHRLCAETGSGLLMRAQTLNQQGDVIEQIAFTQVNIGALVARNALKSSYASTGTRWRVENAAAAPADLTRSGWILNELPAGFVKVMELSRTLPGQSKAVGHMVLSDGLAAVSVFIEPPRGTSTPPESRLSTQGAINVYSRQVAGYTVTVLGEAPADSVVKIGNAIEFQKP